MADESEGPDESKTKWETLYKRSSEQHDPQMADESEGPRESNAEWETLYNRSSEQHDPIEVATDVRRSKIDSATDDCIFTSTKCMGTQTDSNPFSEENLNLVAEEMARAVHESFHSDGELKRLLSNRDIGGHYVSFTRKLFSSTETKTDAENESSFLNDTDLNFILHDAAERFDINPEELGEGLPDFTAMFQAQLINNAEMVSNRRDPFGTHPATSAKLMDATVAVKKVSVIPRQTNDRYAQTEPCNLYDISEESLKAIGRQIGGETARLITKRKDADEIEHSSFPDGFLEILMNFSLEDVCDLLQMYCNKFLAELILCTELRNAQEVSDNVDTHRSSSEVDTETTNAADGTKTQPEIPEKLKTIAEEIARVLDMDTDADGNTLMNIRRVIGCDQHNEKLIKLMNISPGDCSVMDIDIDQNKGCGDDKQNNTELSTTSTLSKLIRGHLDKRKLRDDNQNANKVRESNFSQPTLEEHQKYGMVSLATSVGMSFIGYGPDIRKQRIEWYKQFGRRFNAIFFGLASFLIVGSKSEGLTRFFESDIDAICLLNRIKCIENDNDASGIGINQTVLIMETDDRYPGYCRLILKRYDSSVVFGLSRAFLKDEAGRLFLSSDGFLKLTGGWFLRLPDVPLLPRSGPSLPSVIKNMHVDRVVALRCHCPNILKRWAERPRHWPPPDVVQKVVALEAFVAPVGFKESNSKNLEWRICFNTAETELIINLNDTQTKLYVLLKMVVKDLLKPRRKEITSYTVKNIVLWLAEKNQLTLFHDRSLLHWLHKGLEELRTAISSKNLAYFMIPERNLMAACGLENKQQRVWVDTLTEMINEGPMVIRRFQKIRQAIISCPEPLFWYSKIRMELEMLLFVMINCIAQLLDSRPDTDSTLGEMVYRVVEIIEEVHERLNKEGIWFYDIWDLIVRMMS